MRNPQPFILPAASSSSLVLTLIIIVGMSLSVILSRWIDAHRSATATDQEQLYLSGEAARQMSLGFSGLVADWYWMRSLQYVGNKILSLPQDTQLDDLSQLDLKLLAPLLDAATTLDPEFLEPYEYAAIVLPAVDVYQAIRITQKGIDANPTAWRLYQHLGYIYWQRGDFQSASEAYGRGAQIPGAPAWMQAMKARMAAEGGSRTTAREIYSRMFEGSSDPKIKEMARLRLLEIDSLEQREVIQKLLANYKQRTGSCPGSWKDIAAWLRARGLIIDESGAPLDPAGTPYLLRSENCTVELDRTSEVPFN
jgi:tetratricopeptide (TPR) repeat protein